MAYILAGSTIRSPQSLKEVNTTQATQNRTLSGAITRDYFGSNKRVWILEYMNTKKADFDTINAVYLSYLSTGSAQSWQVTETNYAVSATSVHVDLEERNFSVKGTDYLSNFTLTLTEA